MSSADGSRRAETAHQNGGNFGDGGQCSPCGTAGLLFLIAFAGFRMPPWLPLFVHESNGVDPSWQMLLNEAVPQGWTFGRDLFFTYGPFGCIHARMYHPETWAVVIAVWVGISVIMADLVWRVTGHGRLSSVVRTLCGIVILEFTSRDAMAVCFTLHAFVILEAVGCSRKDAKTQRNTKPSRPFASLRLCVKLIVDLFQRIRLALPILLLAALPWAKFSYFVTAAFLGCTLAIMALLNRRTPWQAVLLFTACPLTWLMSGATLVECGQFIATGFQLASGYSAAMGLGPESTAGLVVVITAGVVVLMLPVWLVARLRFDDWRLSVLTMLFFHGLLFITWKSCFVRYHAERIPVFLGTVVPLLACGLLASRVGNPKRQRGTEFNENGFSESLADASGYQVQRTGNSINCWQSQWYTFVTTILAAERRCGLPIVIAGLAVLVFAGAIERVRPLTLAEVFGHAVSPLQNQILAVGESAKDPGWRRSTHDSQMQKIREANPIPKVEGSVDVFPSKLIVGFAHGLEMRPRPILQSYAAFTPELIERDVGHFKGDNAPDDVLISVGEIDGRLPTMEDSRAWFELLSRYDLTDSSCELIRLNRRKHLALVLSQEPALSTTVKFGEQVNLPLGLAGPVWCRIQIEPSLVGRAASILYRLPELRLRVYCDRGIDREFRLLRGAVRSGFLISPVVDTRDDLIRLWQWRDGFDAENTSREGRVVSIVCSTANQGVDEMFFETDITVEFFDCVKRVDSTSESARPTDVATLKRSSF